MLRRLASWPMAMLLYPSIVIKAVDVGTNPSQARLQPAAAAYRQPACHGFDSRSRGSIPTPGRSLLSPTTCGSWRGERIAGGRGLHCSGPGRARRKPSRRIDELVHGTLRIDAVIVEALEP